MKETIEIKTFYKLIGGINQLGVEAGTSAPKGGDAGAGGRTFIRLSDEGGTTWSAAVDDEEVSSDLSSISITLGGDSELATLIQALEFTLAVLKKQAHDGKAKTRTTVL